MKVFVSSLISGMEAEREAVKHVIEVFRHHATMAEDFSARTSSPQVTCLQGVRDADLMVLVLGHRYGETQPSGFSATHEEFLEAKGRKPILMFVQSGDADAKQVAFINEASGWGPGLFRDSYSTPEQLADSLIRALRDYEISHAVAPLNPGGLRERALTLLPDSQRDSAGALFTLAIASGPEQSVLRPSEIEAGALKEALLKQALFGSPPLFDPALGTQSGLDGGALVLRQEQRYGTSARVALWESGDVLVELLPSRTHYRFDTGVPTIIEEDITEALQASIRYVAWILAHVDPTQKLTHVALAARLSGGSCFGWRTRAEHAANPNQGYVTLGGDELRGAPVLLTPPHRKREALTMDTHHLVEDLVVLLRRQWNHE